MFLQSQQNFLHKQIYYLQHQQTNQSHSIISQNKYSTLILNKLNHSPLNLESKLKLDNRKKISLIFDNLLTSLTNLSPTLQFTNPI